VYAAGIFSIRFVLQAADQQLPTGFRDLPVEAGFLADILPGDSVVPFADRVIALMFRFSTRITSKRRARSVLIITHQSLRRSIGRSTWRHRRLSGLAADLVARNVLGPSLACRPEAEWPERTDS
jgi:hypothetical protein